MGDPKGFMVHPRQDSAKRPVPERVLDFDEVVLGLDLDQLEIQASRCMDCGVPFCHTFGCPVGNVVPELNDMVYRKQWRRALDILHSTNNMPEVTARICPALCEAACTLSVNQQPVTIRQIELEVVERGWREGWIRAEPAPARSGKKVAIVGSGPAGLAAAQQLVRAGHDVTVLEKADRIGGILRYGIPDFKLPKWVLDRRLEQFRAEGVVFETQVEAGVDLSVRYMRRSFDAILIAAGCRVPRELDVPGRALQGMELAIDYLTQQNRRNAGDAIADRDAITARDKAVVVIGGGDTGADCVGTARRQGAKTITQVELLPKPPESRLPDNPWPTWPRILRTSSSHDEGCDRLWSMATKECLGQKGRLHGLRCVHLDWSSRDGSGRLKFREIPESEVNLPADLVLLAMGFARVEHSPLVEQAGLKTDERGNLEVDAGLMTSAAGVFAAGDSVTGASLVVKAIDLGRRAAASIDRYLSDG